MASIPALEGCAELAFYPSIRVQPETRFASTPSGMDIDVNVPQKGLLESGQTPESDVRDTTVALPEGVQLSPSAANGLQACSEQQIGFTGINSVTGADQFTPGPVACPAASKLGLVHITTPLLPRDLEGAVYLASPAPSGEGGENPFDSLAALYVVAEEPVSRVLVKLAGQVTLNENTLQAATTFRNTPQVPFEELKIALFGGPRAALTTPPLCGDYQLTGAMTPWSGTSPATLSTQPAEFPVNSGADGGACPGDRQPFTPGFTAQSTSTQAGSFTGFTMGITRPDGDQAVGSISLHLPAGVAALLSSVTPCPEPQASQGTCGPESLIGHTTVTAGLGPEPVTPPDGQVFITGPYKGAPFGLSVVTPAVAGPFNLGDVIVRARINIDPNTAAVSIESEPLPTEIKGIPLQLQHISVIIDREDFEFNPTSCNPMSITGALTGAQGATEQIASPFQLQNCQSLPFDPELVASAGAHGSKADGTSLAVKVTSGGVGPNGVAQAGIAKVDLQLPVALSSRLPTLQKACTEAVFNANPASCDEGAVIGVATIHTPVLKNPLTGPAYLVSHGSAAFPDVEFVLQSEGITLVLDGKTDIKDGITYSKFESAPDAPFTAFETVLPAGPHSVLTPNVPEKADYSLCGQSLKMPTVITAQDGAVIHANTPITTTGCGGVLAIKTKLTNAQLLARALQACRKKYRHSHVRRAACEKQARKRNGAKATKKHTPKKK